MNPQSINQSSLTFSSNNPLPPWAHAFAAVGKETEGVIYKYFAERGALADVFKKYEQEDLKQLGEAVGNWNDASAATLLTGIIDAAIGDLPLNIPALTRWTLQHRNDPRSVIECASTEPPPEVDIMRVSSRIGSQKVVFEAMWRLTQRRIALKKLTPLASSNVLAHEASSHPLSMSHPTIIETHSLRNSHEQTFLVEEWLPEVLNDDWKCTGVQQAATLLYCLADAVSVVHALHRVHGDIKPDNIGKKDDLFILLDFGICRKVSEFTKETTATGSLRTMAPELLLNDMYIGDPTKVDIWAIGATLFNFLVGRFPFIERKEKVPRVSDPVNRIQYEAILANRVRNGWSKWVDFSTAAEPVKPILQQCLQLDPAKRPTARELKKLIEQHLSVFLRRDLGPGGFAPIDELKQLEKYLPQSDILALMPLDETTRLKKTLSRLSDTQGFSDAEVRQLKNLVDRLNA